MKIDWGLDTYERNARLKPALIAVLPAALTVMAWAPGHVIGWGGLWTVFVAAGGTALLAHLARDRGKALEPSIFVEFGGRPTELMLTHAQSDNPVLLAQRHSRLRRLMPDVRIPTAGQERADPAAAHKVYKMCVAVLIGRTRDRDRFALLFRENCGYGFRRNLLALKPLGLAVSVAATVILGLRLAGEFSKHDAVSPLMLVFEVLNAAFVLLWLFWIRAGWVMLPARAYAERLMEALDTLE